MRSSSTPPLPYKEQKIATAEGGGVVNALAIDIEAAFLEYLDMFYRLGLAGQAMRRIGAIEFRHHHRARSARRAAHREDPGDRHPHGERPQTALRRDRGGFTAHRPDLAVPRRHQGGVGTGQGRAGARAGRECGQHPALENTAIHLVTLLESLPIQETIEAIEELRELDLPIGSVIVNRNIPTILPSDALLAAADGVIDAETVRADLGRWA